MSTTYWDYIKVEPLLALQDGVEGDESALANEEVLFITVHQIHELWFKLVIRELETARDLFLLGHVPETSLAAVARGLRRVSKVLRFGAEHFSLIETMTTRDYLDFRDKLTPASGYQSGQFREVELLLGLEDTKRVPLGKETGYLDVLREADGSASSALQRVQRRIDEESFKDALEAWLIRTPIEGDVDAFLSRFLAAHRAEMERGLTSERYATLNEGDIARVRAKLETEIERAEAFFKPEDDTRRRVRAALLFIESHRELPLLAWPREIVDLVLDVEQAYLIFRQRHARMVERMIGRRVGTGGTDGVGYLDRTALEYRVYPDLWEIRTFLLRKDRIPPLDHPERYGFRADDSAS